jgi:hypothetical protein
MPLNLNFTGQSVTAAEMAIRAAKNVSRLCLGCGAIIKPGQTCPCQDPGAINCPTCRRNIPRHQLIADLSVHKTDQEDRLEVRINCPRKDCKGYLYADLYLSDFVPSNPSLDTDGQKEGQQKAAE